MLGDSDYGLSPLGGPGPLLQKFPTPIVGASKAGQNYSELGILVPDGVASFSGRAASNAVQVSVSDSLSLTLSEDPVDSQGLSTTDTLRLTLTEVASVFRFVAVTDALALSVSETINLAIVGVTNVTPTDTLSLTLADASDVRVSVAVTDALSLSLTDSGSVAFSLEAKSVTDTLSLALAEAMFLEVFTGVLPLSVADDLRLALTDSAAQEEVVPIVPIARMSFQVRRKRMRFRFL